MYIIETLIKIYLKYSKRQTEITMPQNEDFTGIEDIVTCSHNFMPVDSTGNILACSKCGYVVSNKRLQKLKKKR